MGKLAAHLSETQLDAMRELANIGSGNAATALSAMIGRPVDIDVPRALAVPIAEAIEEAGPSDAVTTAIAMPAVGDLDAIALIFMAPATVQTLCGLLGVTTDTDIAGSALCEVGNILGASYLGALAALTGLRLEPCPPERIVDMAGAILATALVASSDGEIALLLESRLIVAETECSPLFLFIPSPSGLTGMLERLGVGA